jgi:hypothetical protein
MIRVSRLYPNIFLSNSINIDNFGINNIKVMCLIPYLFIKLLISCLIYKNKIEKNQNTQSF